MSMDKFEKDLKRIKAGRNIAGNVKNTSISDLIGDEELIHEWEEYLLESNDVFSYCSSFRKVNEYCKRMSERDFLMICIIMMNNKMVKLEDENFSLQEEIACCKKDIS